MSRTRLSVAVITRDEEHRIGDCLASVAFADDIVVVDSGSTDRTLELARDAGARVFSEPWSGFGPQKQKAIALCRFDHVLLIDADERVSAEAREAIQELLAGGISKTAYSFRRKSYMGQRWIRGCGWWPDRVVRLIDRRQCRVEGLIHERVVVEGTVGELDAHLEHYSFGTYSDLIRKMDAYSDQTSEGVLSSGRTVGPLAPLTHGASMFVKSYVLKRGMFDGVDGLVISLTNAGGAFFKYAKARQKQQQRSGS